MHPACSKPSAKNKQGMGGEFFYILGTSLAGGVWIYKVPKKYKKGGGARGKKWNPEEGEKSLRNLVASLGGTKKKPVRCWMDNDPQWGCKDWSEVAPIPGLVPVFQPPSSPDLSPLDMSLNERLDAAMLRRWDPRTTGVKRVSQAEYADSIEKAWRSCSAIPHKKVVLKLWRRLPKVIAAGGEIVDG